MRQGTRIPVQNVLELVREGIPFDAIIRAYYPDLQIEDIKACIQHAIDVVQVEDTVMTMDYSRREAASRRREDFERYLAASPDVPPLSGDEL